MAETEPVDGNGAQERAYQELNRALRGLRAQTDPKEARAQIEEGEWLREAEGYLDAAGHDV